MVDNNTVSAADFSIVIENYPQHLTQAELQAQLNSYGMNLEEKLSEEQLTIVKISMSADPRLEKEDEEEMEDINEKYNNMLEMFAGWIVELQSNRRLPMSPQQRTKFYEKFHKIKYQRFMKGRRLFKTMYKQKIDQDG